MARTLLATLPAAAMALRATRPTVSMHTNIFPTFTIKDKAAVLGQRLLPRRRDFFCFGGARGVRAPAVAVAVVADVTAKPDVNIQ